MSAASTSSGVTWSFSSRRSTRSSRASYSRWRAASAARASAREEEAREAADLALAPPVCAQKSEGRGRGLGAAGASRGRPRPAAAQHARCVFSVQFCFPFRIGLTCPSASRSASICSRCVSSRPATSFSHSAQRNLATATGSASSRRRPAAEKALVLDSRSRVLNRSYIEYNTNKVGHACD